MNYTAPGSVPIAANRVLVHTIKRANKYLGWLQKRNFRTGYYGPRRTQLGKRGRCAKQA